MAGVSQRIDSRIVAKIHALSDDGIRQVNEVQRHLKVFVPDTLFAGPTMHPKSNKRFFPSAKTIRNYVNLVVIKQRYSKVDQENILEKVKKQRKRRRLH